MAIGANTVQKSRTDLRRGESVQSVLRTILRHQASLRSKVLRASLHCKVFAGVLAQQGIAGVLAQQGIAAESQERVLHAGHQHTPPEAQLRT